ncbi:hypothetical protein F5X96DRAFT_572806 [Biscogniauxia mediterranea]|nr:hypothetical protein F5X96DRAFT_572806 [Biscogniauxia mediterranea]
MASWYVGGTEMSRSSSDSSLVVDRDRDYRRYAERRKRRLSYQKRFDLRDGYDALPQWKRPRLTDYADEYESGLIDQKLVPAFFVIKEAAKSMPAIDSGSFGYDYAMLHEPVSTPNYFETSTQPVQYLRVRDATESPDISHVAQTRDKDHEEAAKLVERDLADHRRRGRLSQHERILRSLICPKSSGAEFDIDDDALQGIFYAANEIFFRGRLRGRVTWAWQELPSNLIGTTALRKAPKNDGYETRIFLSKQILQDKKYNRRLLISTFIHELIHSYLFIYCGFHSSECGGHTHGFRKIAELIDSWAGPDLLYLCNMEAELSDFETKKPRPPPHEHVFSGCEVRWLYDGTPGYIVILERPTPSLRFLDREVIWD